jgi:hypothetical protein
MYKNCSRNSRTWFCFLVRVLATLLYVYNQPPIPHIYSVAKRISWTQSHMTRDENVHECFSLYASLLQAIALCPLQRRSLQPDKLSQEILPLLEVVYVELREYSL